MSNGRFEREEKHFKALVERRSHSWQIIYIGLFTAILAFFILIITQVDLEPDTSKRNFQKLVNALYQTTLHEAKIRGIDWIRIENTLSKGVKITFVPSFFKQQPLFYSAKAQINPRYVPYLDELANMIQAIEIQTFPQRHRQLVKQIEALGNNFLMTVRIEGHTDATPLNQHSRFQNNIQLSTFRAYAMMDFLRIHSFLPQSYFSIAGYGGLKPLVADPYSPKNRRVEIYLQPQLIPKGKLYGQ